MELIDDRGLADAGVSGHEHQLRPAGGYHAVEARQDGFDLGRSSVRFLGNEQPVWRVVLTNRKFVDAAMSVPFRKAVSKIPFSTGRRLVALLSGFSEQLDDDCRNRTRDAFHPVGGRNRLS